jgi:hypothetical protein
MFGGEAETQSLGEPQIYVQSQCRSREAVLESETGKLQ